MTNQHVHKRLTRYDAVNVLRIHTEEMGERGAQVALAVPRHESVAFPLPA